MREAGKLQMRTLRAGGSVSLHDLTAGLGWAVQSDARLEAQMVQMFGGSHGRGVGKEGHAFSAGPLLPHSLL
jgi:hypothetical protein